MVKHRPLLSFWVIRPCSLASDCKPIVELITGDIVPAYNEKKRAGGTLPTTINYTGQRLDGSGLVYMNARYYDPLVGMFISPDTIVPDAGALIDYNRFAYGRANPLKFNDPSEHCATIAVAGPPGLVIDLPCWSTVAPYAAVRAAAVAAPVAGMLAIDYVLNEPALDYPTPYPEAEIGEMGASFPLPDSNTLSIEGIPLVTEETYLLVTPDSGTSALSNNPGFTLQQQGMENNVVFITTQEAIANLTHGAQLGRTTKGRSRQWVQQGGLDAAIGAFHALGLANITQRSGGVITGVPFDSLPA